MKTVLAERIAAGTGAATGCCWAGEGRAAAKVKSTGKARAATRRNFIVSCLQGEVSIRLVVGRGERGSGFGGWEGCGWFARQGNSLSGGRMGRFLIEERSFVTKGVPLDDGQVRVSAGPIGQEKRIDLVEGVLLKPNRARGCGL